MQRNHLPANPGLGTPPRISAKKSFGQNFLINPTVINTIVASARVGTGVRCLEIGPGMGALTEALLLDGHLVHAVELDPDACAFLEDKFRDQAHLELIQGDAVQVELPPGSPWSVVGNLPYNAATPILTRFLLEPIPWERLVFMFQLEVGQKILGKPGTKEYGPLSVLSQLCCQVTRLMKLGPGSFRPAPKVDSVVLRFDPRPDAPDYPTRKALLGLLHRSFAHRRKTLSNNWLGFLDPERIKIILEAEGLPPAIRAEAVAPATWLRLLRSLQKIGAMPKEDHGTHTTDL